MSIHSPASRLTAKPPAHHRASEQRQIKNQMACNSVASLSDTGTVASPRQNIAGSFALYNRFISQSLSYCYGQLCLVDRNMSLNNMPFSLSAELHLLDYVITTIHGLHRHTTAQNRTMQWRFLSFILFTFSFFTCCCGTMAIAADVASSQLHRAVTFWSVYSCGCLNGHFASSVTSQRMDCSVFLVTLKLRHCGGAGLCLCVVAVASMTTLHHRNVTANGQFCVPCNVVAVTSPRCWLPCVITDTVREAALSLLRYSCKYFTTSHHGLSPQQVNTAMHALLTAPVWRPSRYSHIAL